MERIETRTDDGLNLEWSLVVYLRERTIAVGVLCGGEKNLKNLLGERLGTEMAIMLRMSVAEHVVNKSPCHVYRPRREN